MSLGLLIGEDDIVSNWAFTTFGFFKTPVNKAIGVVTSDGKLVGAILFQNFNGVNVELSYYGPRTVTFGIVKAIARVSVGTFNASRVTVVTSKRNKRLMRGLLKIGFKLEGAQRCFYGPEDTNRNTGIRFVMFRDRINQLAIGSPKKVLNALQPTTRG